MAKNIEIGERADGSSNIEICFLRLLRNIAIDMIY